MIVAAKSGKIMDEIIKELLGKNLFMCIIKAMPPWKTR